MTAAKHTPEPLDGADDETSFPWRVTFAESGVTVQARGDVNLLDLAEAHGIRLEYGCRSGGCGACKVRCTRGQVVMDDQDGLAASEEQNGYILTCTACPRSHFIVNA